MRRGFKSYSENASLEARRKLGLTPTQRLDPWAYASRLGIHIMGPEDLGLDGADLDQLTVRDPQSWSGVTIREGDSVGVVLNTAHPKTRLANTLMHEIAHIELRHRVNRVEVSEAGLLLLSDYPADQEEEANWLAGSMLLPRVALMHHREKGASVADIARAYKVSDDLCTWRLRMTGVDRQLGYGRGAPF